MGEEVLAKARELADPSEGRSVDKMGEIAQRLLGPWHRSAALEAMGCLIPQDFHPRYDTQKPKGKIGKQDASVGVCIKAGGWRVDIFDEQLLCATASGGEGRLSKAVLEFFLLV